MNEEERVKLRHESFVDWKKIQFLDSDHNHAQFRLFLYQNNIRQGIFFRNILRGIIEQDPILMQFVNKFKVREKIQSKTLVRKVEKNIKKAEETKYLFDVDPLSDKEREQIFTILEREYLVE